jgi:hypothetical protein
MRTTSNPNSPRARILWLVLLCLTLLVPLPRSAAADEPITKAFGQTLGKTFDPSLSTQYAANRNVLMFWYPPPAEIPELTEFFVTVSPLTYRIYGIFGKGPPQDLRLCLDTGRQLFSVISEKYSGEKYGASLNEYTDGRGWLLAQSKTSRRVSVTCDDTGKLLVSYTDEDFRLAAEDEHREFSQINSNYEAAKYDRIVSRLRELADTGNLWAQTLLGLMYGKGLGVRHDDDTAEDYYLRAARRGWLNAEFNLGIFYMSRLRYKPAEQWLLKAAEQQFSQAEESLAQLYLAESPLQNQEKSFTWFLRAAEHGRPDAQYNTCYAYADGLGVQRDMVEAYKWCYISARQGHLRADRNKDHLAEQMRPEELARGRQAAVHWLAQQTASK